MALPSLLALHFGGPGREPGRLRDLLEERVAAVPAGGAIDWATYYFRDRRLARALLAARRRGVRVTLALEAHPRSAQANRAVVDLLSGPDGLGQGLRLVRHARRLSRVGRRRPHLHSKVYCFSHPRPSAWIGSFNPSGDCPELEPEVREEIRDQDRGYNLLAEIADPAAVEGLVRHVRHLHRARHGLLERFAPGAGQRIRTQALELFFLPGRRGHPLRAELRRVGRDDVVRLAASHLKGPTALGTLLGLAKRGARVAVVCEETQRRVPDSAEQRLRAAGIEVRRLAHPAGVPMHDKFVLIERPGRRCCVVFGSFNWTERSFRLNHEVGACCTDPDVVEAFAARWKELAAAAEASPDLLR